MADQIQRAQLLMRQGRYEEAGVILKSVLSQEPANVYVLALLAQVKLQQRLPKEAEQLINSAIGLSPDTDYLYYVKASVALQLNKYDEAESCLKQSIDLNPEGADYYALWASVKVTRKQFADALELADQALELDPENNLGLNVRSSALLKLNRTEDSFNTIEGALAHDPNNPYTHSNYGWSLLEKGDHKKALEHFKEALKNDPHFGQAQAGMLEALKAKYFFYRLFLKYAFFMSNLTAKYQWGVIIGFYVITRGLNTLAQHNEGLRPVLTPILVLLAVIAFSTWVIGPISNLFLRLNVYGKYLLGKEEKMSSDFVAVSLLVFLTGLIFYLLRSDESWLVVAMVGFVLMVPFGTMFTAANHKNKVIAYSALMVLLGAAGIFQAFSSHQPFNMFTTLFILSFIGFQLLINFLRIRQSNV